MSIKAISFDFWNTLFTEQPGTTLFHKQRRRSLLAEAVGAYREISHSELDAACLIEREAHEITWREQHRTSHAAQRVSSILSQLEVSLPDVERAELAAGFEEIILEHPPLLVSGAREVLIDLSGRYRLGIISDVGFSPGRVLKRVLADNGLIEMFDSLVFSDEAGRAKPHREVFERTARSLGAKPEAIVHIGDLERTDIIGAKQSGFRAIRFTGVTPMEAHETTVADFVTSEITEIPRLVELMRKSVVSSPLSVACDAN
ncbi:MAG TPA: HAD family hydrolase [Blastocatellia bacterium]|nr:HAD family hydrolase [Blastocatellia bacterium]